MEENSHPHGAVQLHEVGSWYLPLETLIPLAGPVTCGWDLSLNWGGPTACKGDLISLEVHLACP